MEVIISSDISEANEPLLKVLVSGGEAYINKYLKYPATGGNSSELALIKNIAKGARECCEHALNLSLGEKTLIATYSIDELKRLDYRVELPYGPVSSISEVKIMYADGTTATTLSESDYYLNGEIYKEVDFARLSITGTSKISHYKITYVAGFGASGCPTLPEGIRVAMAELATKWYSNRENASYVIDNETRAKLKHYTRKSWI